MLKIAIPSQRVLHLEYLLLDMNGTITLDGRLVSGVRERMERLSGSLDVWLVSADTQGTLKEVATTLQARARRLQSGGEATQKAALVGELGAEQVVAIGNGVNDVLMLRQAALGTLALAGSARVAVLGGEGLSAACRSAADMIALNIEAALDLLLYPRRLITIFPSKESQWNSSVRCAEYKRAVAHPGPRLSRFFAQRLRNSMSCPMLISSTIQIPRYKDWPCLRPGSRRTATADGPECRR